MPSALSLMIQELKAGNVVAKTADGAKQWATRVAGSLTRGSLGGSERASRDIQAR